MRYFERFVCLTVLAFVMASVSCREKHNLELTGVWDAELQGRQSQLVLKSDGTYDCTVTPSTGMVQRFEGRWEVRDGVFIDSLVRHTATNIAVPFVSRAKIIALSKDEFTLQGPGDTEITRFRRRVR